MDFYLHCSHFCLPLSPIVVPCFTIQGFKAALGMHVLFTVTSMVDPCAHGIRVDAFGDVLLLLEFAVPTSNER